jgi:2TM domain
MNTTFTSAPERNEYLMKIARRRVGFQKHALVYFIVCSVISLLCLVSGGRVPVDLWWAWGIGLGFHGIGAYGLLIDEEKAAENEYQRLLRQKSEM